MITRRHVSRFALLSFFAGVAAVSTPAPLLAGDDPWPGLRSQLFGSRPIVEGSADLTLFAPDQAQDAAVVPVSFRLTHKLAVTAKQIMLIIDRNPSPVAATFVFGDAYRSGPDIGDRTLATRVRVDAFSRVRAIIETTDGALVMVSKFVIGSGGCSSPASKDLDQALASLGKSEVQSVVDQTRKPGWREAVVKISHPNYSGLQMDAKTGQFTPARFVDALEVTAGGAMVLRMEGGISISENPNLRFTFGQEGEAPLKMTAKDTDGVAFAAEDVGGRS